METAALAVNVQPLTDAPAPADPRGRLRRVIAAGCDGLYRFILVRVAGDRDAADEVLQQTCHEATRHRRVPDDDTECEAWLRGIARNLIRRHWRRRRQHNHQAIENVELLSQLAEDLEARPLPPDAMIKEETARQLLLAVTSLSAADQRLVFAFYFECRPQADIADEIGVSAKSVESRLYRVRQRLRAFMRDADERK